MADDRLEAVEAEVRIDRLSTLQLDGDKSSG